jgi:dipeptidyl aminopeptidase/acylaminoacyl peptidase
MFHGTGDINVRIQQSQVIDRALAAAGVKHQLIILEGLDHHLDDSIARTDMLRRNDAFLRDSFAQNSASTH